MPSPRFERVQELFRQRAEIEDEIEHLISGGDPDETPPELRHTGRERPLGVVKLFKTGEDGGFAVEVVRNRKPCGCALRGRSKASCRVCNPTIEDFVASDDDADEEVPTDKVCECGGVKRHKRDCPNRDQPPVVYADEQLGPLKKYKCISCDTVVESRQHRLDLTCRPPCMSKTMVEIFDDDDV